MPRDITVSLLATKPDYKSFRLDVPNNVFDQVVDMASWPNGVVIRPFRLRTKLKAAPGADGKQIRGQKQSWDETKERSTTRPNHNHDQPKRRSYPQRSNDRYWQVKRTPGWNYSGSRDHSFNYNLGSRDYPWDYSDARDNSWNYSHPEDYSHETDYQRRDW